MIDFELKHDLRKVKFIENCYSDAEDVCKIIKDHRCVVLPKQLVETFARNGSLEFRFVIKRNEDIKSENAEKEKHRKNSASIDSNGSKQSGAATNKTTTGRTQKK